MTAGDEALKWPTEAPLHAQRSARPDRPIVSESAVAASSVRGPIGSRGIGLTRDAGALGHGKGVRGLAGHADSRVPLTGSWTTVVPNCISVYSLGNDFIGSDS